MSALRNTLLAVAAAAPLLAGTGFAAAQAPAAQGQQAQPQAGAAERASSDPQVKEALPPASVTQQEQPQNDGAGPPRGTPEIQGRVPESSAAGTNEQRQAPSSTTPEQPTGTPAAPQPVAPPQPVQPIPAPPPLGDRGTLPAAELELQNALKGNRITGRVSIPDEKLAVLVQPEGRDWRAFRNGTLLWVGTVAVLGMLALLALFYLVRGRIRVRSGWSGRTMERFNFFERMNHWMTAGSFIVLALSGLNLTFGRHLIRPLIGPEAFTALADWGKIAHNFLAFPFTVGVLVMLLMWAGDNLPNKLDWVWLKNGGGFIGNAHPQAGRFNAGQKGIFWITVLGGGVVAISGFLLMFPFFLLDIGGQQWGHMVHGTLSMLLIAVMLAHIYIGTLGMEGGFSAMGSGRVDYNWAREHHSMWVDDELKRAHDAVQPKAAARPAGAD
ncbi:MAG TPA: formate dehydrogenase subunit gamma [Roseomonas sp.]|nr:formate dehydrogenase subunit gamma [Roseomonas sp.]